MIRGKCRNRIPEGLTFKTPTDWLWLNLKEWSNSGYGPQAQSNPREPLAVRKLGLTTLGVHLWSYNTCCASQHSYYSMIQIQLRLKPSVTPSSNTGRQTCRSAAHDHAPRWPTLASKEVPRPKTEGQGSESFKPCPAHSS